MQEFQDLGFHAEKKHTHKKNDHRLEMCPFTHITSNVCYKKLGDNNVPLFFSAAMVRQVLHYMFLCSLVYHVRVSYNRHIFCMYHI
jgi:hypothetical protein